MVTPETMSVGARYALEDMVELKMYLLSQSQQTLWLMLPQTRTDSFELKMRRLNSSSVEASAANELLDLGFIGAISNRTFVVSDSGLQFYQRQRIPTSPLPE